MRNAPFGFVLTAVLLSLAGCGNPKADAPVVDDDGIPKEKRTAELLERLVWHRELLNDTAEELKSQRDKLIADKDQDKTGEGYRKMKEISLAIESPLEECIVNLQSVEEEIRSNTDGWSLTENTWPPKLHEINHEKLNHANITKQLDSMEKS